ncbi:MAG: hypothetical protein LBJ94_01495 [Puniceicoccales bacterium]|jgi:hypothetical protein|nr:hypothetical protein [Puniceicoccales bacterium]
MNTEELHPDPSSPDWSWQPPEGIDDMAEDIPPFTKADAAMISAFEKELGIKIPEEIYKSVQMYKFGHYFSSKDGFLGTNTEHQFIELLSSATPLIAFGQAGYGFNSGRFELHYVDDKFAYKLDAPFGGAFMNNDEIAKELTATLAQLPALIEKYNADGSNQVVTVIFDNGRAKPSISQFDKNTREFIDSSEE